MRTRTLLAAAALACAGALVPAGSASAYCADLSPVDDCFNHCEVLDAAARTYYTVTHQPLPGGPYYCPR